MDDDATAIKDLVASWLFRHLYGSINLKGTVSLFMEVKIQI